LKVKRVLLTIALSLFAAAALAATITAHYTWTNATTNVDGSAIPATGAGAITSTAIEYGPCTADQKSLASVTNTVTVAGDVQASDVALPSGVWCAHALHVNSYGKQSLWSNVAVRDNAPTPNPPKNFT
jgi:hypothetical protein